MPVAADERVVLRDLKREREGRRDGIDTAFHRPVASPTVAIKDDPQRRGGTRDAPALRR